MSCGCIRADTGAMEDLDTLLRFVAPIVPDVPYDVAIDHVRQAYIEFARRSRLLASHQTITKQRDVTEYLLAPPQGYEVFALLQPKGRAYFMLPNAHFWFAYYGDDVRMVGNDRIELARAPTRDGDKWEIALHVLPSQCVSDIPQQIATPYGRGIAMGAVAALLEIPNRAWSNPRAADRYQQQFDRTCMAGKNLSLTNLGSTTPMMRPVRVL